MSFQNCPLPLKNATLLSLLLFVSTVAILVSRSYSSDLPSR